VKAGIVALGLAMCSVGGVIAAEAAAATGDLIQKPGAAGCLSMVGFCSPGTALEAAATVAVSPDGRNAYVASHASDAVAVFDRAADGTLTQKPGTAACISNTGAGSCVDGTALGGAASVTISPDGRSAYVASDFVDAVAVLDRAPDGTLTQKPGTAACISDTGAGGCADGTALDGARSVTVTPDGRSAYVASFISDAVAVFDRAADGTLTQKSGLAGCISETGTSGACVDGAALDYANSVTVSPDGQSAYVTSYASDAVALFDRAADGMLTEKPRGGRCISETGGNGCADGTALDGAVSVTVSPDGLSAYVASRESAAVALFDRAPNGTLAQKPGPAACISDNGAGPCVDGTVLNAARSVTVSPDGQSAYVVAGLGGGMALFDRAADGTLAQKPGVAGCISHDGSGGSCVDGTALNGADSLTVSPDGRSAYVAAGDAVAVFDREPRPGPATPSTEGAQSDTTKPLLRALSVSPTSFHALRTGPSIAARVGANVSYTLSEPAAVRFRVRRALPGRRIGGRCAKSKRSNRRAKRCTRYRTLRGGLTHSGRSGQNSFAFSGRLSARKLRPGGYRLLAVATDSAANESRAKHSRFKIIGR
jgi:DNA-binding beta-propeller fold protein YncE